MPRTFITITTEENDDKLAESIRSREQELLSYDFEKENHKKALNTLGNIDWTPETMEYKGLARDVMIARALAAGLTDAQISDISDLLSKDKHTAELHAVKVETRKSERHYDALLISLPAGAARDAALARVKAKEDARKAKELGTVVK